MLRKNIVSGLLFAVVFMPSILLAQEMMPGKWWHDKAIVNELQLTDSEKKELDRKYIENRRKMIDLKSQIEKNRFELDLLLGMEDLDKEKAMEYYDNLERARSELSKQRFEMLMGVRETIGAERFQELKSMHRTRGRKENKKSPKEKSSYRYNKRDRDY
ncbi:MAG: periplasmic heavy metal sensor [Desulfobulbales bacterium]|nr:periplasmic heavy metal sensor [Desulfobulbales bacterium]